MNLKKSVKKGVEETGKKSAKAGSSDADIKHKPGAGDPAIPAKQSFLMSIVRRIVAGKKSGNISNALMQKVDENSKMSIPTPRGAGGASIDRLKQDIADAQEALKKKDLRSAGVLYDAITANYNLIVFDPKCDKKAVKALYDDISQIYTALSKSHSSKEEDIVFKPLNEAGAADKNETTKPLLPLAGKEASKKGGSAKMLPEEQIIYTVIDSMIEIVESKGEISLQELSKILNIPVGQTEELSKILDEHGILQLHYPSNPMAHPLLRSVSKHDFKRLGRQE